jgi:hypothetical protein
MKLGAGLGISLSLAFLLAASRARAWGDEGHRAIGELAFHYLSPSAQAKVREALSEPGYQTLAEAATWPDSYARRHAEYDALKPFHYVNVDARALSFSAERDCPHGCVVTALTQFALLLGSHDPPPTLAERRTAIYWIAHLMGDIHQPLHIAHPDGKGGNATLLTFFDAPKAKSAHWIWDTGLLEQRPAPRASDGGGSANFQALATQLWRSLNPAKARAFRRTTSPEAIANETLAVSRRYAFLRSSDRVDAAYEATRWPVVAEQLQKSGIRLAEVLERALE